ncbi:MAG: urea ABC transporter permease subunit UrtB [Methylomicrobium sp.]|nr:urea ABC transporter permease subunit UrtB [Methylomicrobium sp.]
MRNPSDLRLSKTGSPCQLSGRRLAVKALCALPVSLLLASHMAWAAPATSEVNTTGLAVTDDTVTVGILHSVTGTMAIEVGVTLPDWMMGSYALSETIEIPINGIFVMVLTLFISLCVYLLMFRSRWGKQVRAVVLNRPMAGAVGINTEKIDRYTFGIGCGVAGIAGSAFTMIGSTGPTSGQLYIVDTFLVVVFGGAQSLLGTIASAFTISQSQSTLEFFLSGSMAKVITLLLVVGILMLRPQGLFALKIRH